jgi:hypothetical protein
MMNTIQRLANVMVVKIQPDMQFFDEDDNGRQQ